MTAVRSHSREIVLHTTPQRAFELLITPSDIRAWWGAARAIVQPEPGGAWAAAWGDDENDPDYTTVATMRIFDPPRRIVLADYRYTARTGPLPFKADFTVEFTVSPHADGALLTVTQDGFPADSAADEFYRGCETGWANTFESIRRHIEND